MAHRLATCGYLSLCLGAALPAAEWAEEINLEAHGFASFGYLHSGGNSWLGDTEDGSAELVEAALNVIARPGDRWRFGAQVFLRDLVDYDNGKPQLDWAYADYRFRDELGLQVGRVKFPLGLHNEVWDVDAARTTVFLPRSVYDQRLRDLTIAVDGAKCYGVTDRWQYAVYLGDKTIDEEAGFGTFFERATGFAADDIDVDLVAGGMLDRRFANGLNLRLSCYHIEGLETTGRSASMDITNRLDLDYDLAIASLQYEWRDWSFSSELAHRRGRGDITVPAIGFDDNYEDDLTSVYLAATWHIHPELDLYLAQEYAYLDYNQLSRTYDEWISVVAAAYRPMEHLSLKAEFQLVDGQVFPLTSENDHPLRDHWWIAALKATVDF